MKNDTCNNTNICMHMLFEINGRCYSVPISYVVEILPICQLSTPQKMQAYTIGWLDYRNYMVNVVDIRKILGVEDETYSLNQKLLVLQNQDSVFAVVVDKILTIDEVSVVDIQDAPYSLHSGCIKYIYHSTQGPVSIVDVPTLFRDTQSFQPDDELNLLEFSQTDLPVAIERANKNKLINQAYQLSKYVENDKYLIFVSGDSKFCVDISKIEKIIDTNALEITPIPTKSDYIEGVANFHGSFLTVIDFARFLSQKSSSNVPYEKQKVIVFFINDFKVGFIVDYISAITPIANEEIIENNEYSEVYSFAHNMIVKNDEIYFIIDFDELLKDSRMYIND